jgi:hypothetical protein
MPLSGKLLVVEPKFNGQTSYNYTVAQLKNLGNEITKFYKTNSRGLLTLTPFVEQLEINAAGSTVLSQTTLIKNKFPGYLFYILVSVFVNGDHSGDSVGFVKSCQYESANHETGHLLRLQHSDTWVLQGTTYTLVPLQDGLSCMSKDPSGYLVAPQYVFLGWIPSDEILKISSLPATFKLQRISDFGSIKGVPTVAMVSESLTKNAKVLYISYPQVSKGFGPKPSVVLHLEYGNSGSEKIKEFASEYYDSYFTGLNVSLVSNADGTITVTVTNTPPSASHHLHPTIQTN